MTVESAAQPQTDARAADRPMWRRLMAPGLVAGGLAAATVALHFRDPHVEGSWGFCPSAALGFWCPGCGGLRSVNDLSNAQIGDAASSNLLFVASLPLIAYVFVRWTAGRVTGNAWSPSMRSTNVVAIVLIALMVVFTVLRNLPMGAWLAP